jgi:hypothetical protein
MTAFVANTLQFLDEKRAKTSAAARLRCLHVDVAIRPVVVPPELISGNIPNLVRGRLAKRGRASKSKSSAAGTMHIRG